MEDRGVDFCAYTKLLADCFKEWLGHGEFTDDGWIATVGIPMRTCCRLLSMLPPPASDWPRSLLMALNFLKEYRVEAAACLQFGYRSESTYEGYVWETLRLIDARLPPVRFLLALTSCLRALLVRPVGAIFISSAWRCCRGCSYHR
jgi:hypothetical protein